jgi:cytochrome b561
MKTSYSLSDRILHWALALTILFMLLTVFLRLNWMEKNHVAAILIDKLSALDVEITKDQAIKIAKQIRKPMFDWHITIGYVVTGIFVLRMIFHIKNKRSFNPITKREKFQLWVYRIFYVLLAATLITGLIIEFGPKCIKKSIVAIHKLTLYYMVTFLILHFSGILLAEIGSKKGIVSKMIGGDK